MMTTTDSRRGRMALMVAHCAGMVDLVALPVWVGTLISRYHFDPQQAGGMVTLFLAGAVVASLMVAPRMAWLPTRWVAAGGFAGAAAAFLVLGLTREAGVMAALHAFAGLCAGAALSVTHGTIGRSARPHRLFATVGVALGVFGIAFMGATPPMVAALGGSTLFTVFGCVMIVGALMSAWAFPIAAANPVDVAAPRPGRGSIARPVWFGIVGIGAMGVVQAMAFSFVERAGADRGFGLAAVTAVLVAGGIVNLFPAALAAVLEKRWVPGAVLRVGPVVQALLVLTVMTSTSFMPYAVAASLLVAVMIFTHTFAFGLLAALEPTGRALAATPAMLMVGAAIGPVLGGTLVKAFGYPSLGWAAVAIALVATLCMTRLPMARASMRLQEAS